jgi:hypothetical protein
MGQPETKPKAKKPAKRTEPDDSVSVARDLRCNEDKGRFERKLGKIAKTRAFGKSAS